VKIKLKKKILIFCASGYGIKVAYHLDFDCELVAFVDNNPLYNGNWGGGKKCITPSEIKNYDYDLIVIAIADYEAEITAQLLSLGVSQEKIVTFCPNNKVRWLDERYAAARACIRYIKERNIAGNIAELGVYKGEFSAFLSEELPSRKIYLFDTFEGFADADLATKEISGNEQVFRDTSVQLVLERMPRKDNVIIRKGWFPETAIGVNDTFCFVSLDADLYKPILAGLEFFYPRLNHGGYIFIHDFESITYPGCKQAVMEFCGKNKVSFVPILDRCASAVITK